MIFKDALIFSFFFDKDDPEELAAFEALKKRIDVKLRGLKLGRFDDASYDAKGQCFKIDTLGNDAAAMLDALSPVIREADFLIGPKATLIIRSFEQNGKTLIKHVDL